MRFNPVSNWFRPKTIGFGWTPSTWEGWASMLAGIAVIVAASRAL